MNDLKFLSLYGENLTEKYRNNDDFSPVLWRELETRELLGILCTKFKNNAILVGEAGTGKTAIVEGLAQALALDAVPDSLRGFNLWELDIAKLSNKGESDGGYRFRVKQIVEEIIKNQKIILFVDETHVILDKESDLDIGDLLKPALARGQLRMIGSTTDWEFHKYIEQDKALVRRYSKVTVQELKKEGVIQILRSRKHALEVFHNVTVLQEAIDAAVDLSIRYIPSRRNPDKSIDILDKACALTRLAIDNQPKELRVLQGEIAALEADLELETDEEELKFIQQELDLKKPLYQSLINSWTEQKNFLDTLKELRIKLLKSENLISIEEMKGEDSNTELIGKLKAELVAGEKALEQLKVIYKNEFPNPLINDVVNKEVILQTIESMTGIPVSELSESELSRLRRLEDDLHNRIIGQDEAVRKTAYSIKRSRLGLGDPEKPIGSFIFLGPSGVGKALSNLTEIPTANRGFVKLENLEIGDKVFTPKGTTSSVIGIFPQGLRKHFFVMTEDNQELICDGEHLFTIINKNNLTETITVNEIINRLENKEEIFLLKTQAVQYEDFNQLKELESLYFLVGKHTEQITYTFKTVSETQRLDILRGAFDLYGFVEDNKLFFETDKEILFKDVRELLFSLGIRNKKIEDNKLEILYSESKEVYQLFGRKKNRDKVFLEFEKRSPYKAEELNKIKITKITTDHTSEEMTCILIDDEDHLFLAGRDYVPTHNTELVKALAETIFGSENSMKRFDMGEFKSINSVSRLIGAPPGEDKLDTGGELTEYVKKNPYSILLFDEAEKGYYGIYDVFLSMLDDGKLADSRGEVVDFSNTIIILTSNIGQEDIIRGQNKETGELFPEVKDKIMAKLKNGNPENGGKGFKPEFVNRLGAPIIFYSLTREELEEIANLKLKSFKKRLLKSRNIKIVYGEKIIYRYHQDEDDEPMMDIAYFLAHSLTFEEMKLGGRPIQRLIEEKIENQLVDIILNKGIPNDSYLLIRMEYPPGLDKVYDKILQKEVAIDPIIRIHQIDKETYEEFLPHDPTEQ